MPMAKSTTAELNSTAPKMRDCTWPAPSPVAYATTKRVNGINPRTKSARARAKKTFSGSYWA